MKTLPITNAHTHLELADLSYLCPSKSMSFVPWMTRLAWHSKWLAKRQIQSSIQRGIAELKACGTTHVGDVTATWQTVEPLLTSGLQGIVYLEVLGLSKRRALARLERAKVAIEKIRTHPDYGLMQVGLSLHAPYSCHSVLLRAGAAWCRAEGVALCVHVAESRAETEFLVRGRISSSGLIMRFMSAILATVPSHVPYLRPVSYLASLGVLDACPLLVHAIHVTDEDIRMIADAGCAVVHCPRSNARLSCGRMPLERYLAARVPVYLGTDSRASCRSLDVREEAAFARDLHAGIIDPAKVTNLIHQGFP